MYRHISKCAKTPEKRPIYLFILFFFFFFFLGGGGICLLPHPCQATLVPPRFDPQNRESHEPSAIFDYLPIIREEWSWADYLGQRDTARHRFQCRWPTDKTSSVGLNIDYLEQLSAAYRAPSSPRRGHYPLRNHFNWESETSDHTWAGFVD